MFTIDSHQHFWKYDLKNHAWINDEMKVIRKDFLPNDLLPILQDNRVGGCVAVQADQTESETNFLLDLAAQNKFIKGVVGWVDLCAENSTDRLEHFNQFNVLKGFRHILQGESPEFILQPSFLNGISKLSEFNFTYDILVFPKHLRAVLQLVRQMPQQKFVIDHIAKPPIKEGLIDDWKKDLQEIAKCDNVYCKISGVVTEADWNTWTQENIKPYLDTVVTAFGTHRILFGSDWPVCLVAASYTQWITLVRNYFSSFSIHEQEKFFSSNAISFYQLK